MGILGGSLTKDGSWWVRSESDPRWNCQGRSHVGGLVCPGAAMKKIETLKETLGEDPPDDLEFGYMKD